MTSFSSLYHVPYFIGLGLNDYPEFVKQSKEFAANCEREGLPYVYMEHPTGKHGFDALSDDERAREIISRVIDFYKEYLD
ncbi:MAG: hypothetical protein PQJ61_13100 [Spirochaetales bacterium]|uniref:Uncharacterized protein n=1 Tax=Candidatus Thalassospirochaeta sargassi TaxID=3119039 RepID=A0AAJ1IE94_9SPIO|nr:hypothetical protein [Spirochaetales bacterium]